MHTQELSKLYKFIEQSHGSHPIVLTDDFNIAGDSVIFQDFIKMSALKDVLSTDFTPTFHKEFLPPGEPGRRIDQILASENAIAYKHLFNELIGFRGVKTVFLSDHIGVYASIDMAPKSIKNFAP